MVGPATDLVIDIGNTRAHLAGIRCGQVLAAEALSSEPAALQSGLAEALARLPLREGAAAVLVSVNPVATTLVREGLVAAGLAPLELGVEIKVPAGNKTLHPDAVGLDRLMNATWAGAVRAGKRSLVVSAGTAVTFDLIDAEGALVGGVIAPGLGMLSRGLARDAALLPAVEVRGAPRVLGRATEEALASGMFWGLCGAVEGILVRLLALPELAGAEVVATGGDAALIAPYCPHIGCVVEHLTLLGAWWALEASRG